VSVITSHFSETTPTVYVNLSLLLCACSVIHRKAWRSNKVVKLLTRYREPPDTTYGGGKPLRISSKTSLGPVATFCLTAPIIDYRMRRRPWPRIDFEVEVNAEVTYFSFFALKIILFVLIVYSTLPCLWWDGYFSEPAHDLLRGPESALVSIFCSLQKSLKKQWGGQSFPKGVLESFSTRHLGGAFCIIPLPFHLETVSRPRPRIYQ
jgi:hypothetical protein